MDCSLSGLLLPLLPRKLSNDNIKGGKRLIGTDRVEMVGDQINIKCESNYGRANDNLLVLDIHLIGVRSPWDLD